ncbi:MAG: helix-turn-helix domain-containing protein [Deltaproteobacteria bacterium]|nr:helix-turn-helix domain-containing protein [Deltaproteobacteria bacterium]
MQLQHKKLSVEQTAERLGVSPHTIRAWVREQRIAFYRIGRRILFDEADIQALEEKSRVEPLAR